jgi:protoporphyrinogen oxidase
VRGGVPLPLPSSAAGFLGTRLFSARAKLRLLAELWIGRAPAEREESVAEFVRRRLGPEFLDYAINPFVGGVYAGDPARLSTGAPINVQARGERERLDAPSLQSLNKKAARELSRAAGAISVGLD